MKTNYSIATSLPAYKENPSQRATQCNDVYKLVAKGANNLKQLERLVGTLPQSTIAARVNDLINDGKVEYVGHVVFESRLRKRIQLAKAAELIVINNQIQIF